MMRCGKLKTGSLFSRRLKFLVYGGVSLILVDFGISMAHAQGRGSHGMAMRQPDGALWVWSLLVTAVLPIFDKIINHRWIGQG